MVLEVVICLHIMTVPIVDQDVGLILNNSSLEGVNVSPPDTNSLAAAYETFRTQVFNSWSFSGAADCPEDAQWI